MRVSAGFESAIAKVARGQHAELDAGRGTFGVLPCYVFLMCLCVCLLSVPHDAFCVCVSARAELRVSVCVCV